MLKRCGIAARVSALIVGVLCTGAPGSALWAAPAPESGARPQSAPAPESRVRPQSVPDADWNAQRRRYGFEIELESRQIERIVDYFNWDEDAQKFAATIQADVTVEVLDRYLDEPENFNSLSESLRKRLVQGLSDQGLQGELKRLLSQGEGRYLLPATLEGRARTLVATTWQRAIVRSWRGLSKENKLAEVQISKLPRELRAKWALQHWALMSPLKCPRGGSETLCRVIANIVFHKDQDALEFKYRNDYVVEDLERFREELDEFARFAGVKELVDRPVRIGGDETLSLHVHVSGPGIDERYFRAWNQKTLLDLLDAGFGPEMFNRYGYTHDIYARGLVRMVDSRANHGEIRNFTLHPAEGLKLSTREIALEVQRRLDPATVEGRERMARLLKMAERSNDVVAAIGQIYADTHHWVQSGVLRPEEAHFSPRALLDLYESGDPLLRRVAIRGIMASPSTSEGLARVRMIPDPEYHLVERRQRVIDYQEDQESLRFRRSVGPLQARLRAARTPEEFIEAVSLIIPPPGVTRPLKQEAFLNHFYSMSPSLSEISALVVASRLLGEERFAILEKAFPLVRSARDFLALIQGLDQFDARIGSAGDLSLNDWARSQLDFFFSKNPTLLEIKMFERTLVSDPELHREVMKRGLRLVKSAEDFIHLAAYAHRSYPAELRMALAGASSNAEFIRTNLSRFLKLKPTFEQYERLLKWSGFHVPGAARGKSDVLSQGLRLARNWDEAMRIVVVSEYWFINKPQPPKTPSAEMTQALIRNWRSLKRRLRPSFEQMARFTHSLRWNEGTRRGDSTPWEILEDIVRQARTPEEFAMIRLPPKELRGTRLEGVVQRKLNQFARGTTGAVLNRVNACLVYLRELVGRGI